MHYHRVEELPVIVSSILDRRRYLMGVRVSADGKSYTFTMALSHSQASF